MTTHPSPPRASSMRYYDSFLTYGSSGGNSHAFEAEMGVYVLIQWQYENDRNYLRNVPLVEVLRLRLARGEGRNGMSSAPVDNGTTGEVSAQGADGGNSGGPGLVAPQKPSPAEDDYEQQDREAAALRHLYAPVFPEAISHEAFSAWELGQEWDNYAEVEG